MRLRSVDEQVEDYSWNQASHLSQVDDPLWTQLRKQIRTPLLIIIYAQVVVPVWESIIKNET
jgi:hypothetical protein